MTDTVTNDRGGQRTVTLRIQTPRGEWNRKEPPNVRKRPIYPISTKVEQVVADVREVFGFVEDDNKYQLLNGKEPLEPQHPLSRYRLKDGTLLVLTVQGGNAYQSVEPVVSLEAVKIELAEAEKFAASAGLVLETSKLSEAELKFSVRFFNRADDLFFTAFDCTDYPLMPPYIEFTDEAGENAGVKSFYPLGFHTNPCVCMRYNRKAYTEHGGPHGDWRMVDWHLATPGGGPIGTLAMIISDLHAKILTSDGRMQ